MNAHKETKADPASGVVIFSTNPAHVRVFQSALNVSAMAHVVKSALHDAAVGNPSLVIIDAQGSVGDPLQLLKQVRAAIPHAALVLVTSQPDPNTASRAMRSGASAYLAAPEIPTLLHQAIHHVKKGERFVSENVMQGILHGMVETGDEASRIPVEILSDREMMVFRLVGKGMAMNVIARELGINIKTVSTHCHNIRSKLSIPDNLQLAKISHAWLEAEAGPAGMSRSIVASGKQ